MNPITPSASVRASTRAEAVIQAQQRQAEMFRQAVLLAVLVAVAAVAAPLRAQPPPERERAGASQAVGALHGVRTIPQA